jgi:hypothetical protein
MGKYIVMAVAALVFATGVFLAVNRMPDDDGPPAEFAAGDTIQRQEDAITIPETAAVEADEAQAETVTADTAGEVTVETIEDTVAEAGVADPAEGATDDPVNDEAALDADTIGVGEASDPGYIANALTAENFEAERVVALIENSPQLTEGQKVSLTRSVQAVAEDPAALEAVLEEMRAMLLDEG